MKKTTLYTIAASLLLTGINYTSVQAMNREGSSLFESQKRSYLNKLTTLLTTHQNNLSVQYSKIDSYIREIQDKSLAYHVLQDFLNVARNRLNESEHLGLERALAKTISYLSLQNSEYLTRQARNPSQFAPTSSREISDHQGSSFTTASLSSKYSSAASLPACGVSASYDSLNSSSAYAPRSTRTERDLSSNFSSSALYRPASSSDRSAEISRAVQIKTEEILNFINSVEYLNSENAENLINQIVEASSMYEARQFEMIELIATDAFENIRRSADLDSRNPTKRNQKYLEVIKTLFTYFSNDMATIASNLQSQLQQQAREDSRNILLQSRTEFLLETLFNLGHQRRYLSAIKTHDLDVIRNTINQLMAEAYDILDRR